MALGELLRRYLGAEQALHHLAHRVAGSLLSRNSVASPSATAPRSRGASSAAARRYGRQPRAPPVRAVRTTWDRASADRQPRRSAAWRRLPDRNCAPMLPTDARAARPAASRRSSDRRSDTEQFGDQRRRGAPVRGVSRQYCLQPGQPRRARRVGVEPRRIAKECDHRAERAVRIEIGRREMHHTRSGASRRGEELLHQARLADAGLAHHHHCIAVARGALRQCSASTRDASSRSWNSVRWRR